MEGVGGAERLGCSFGAGDAQVVGRLLMSGDGAPDGTRPPPAAPPSNPTEELGSPPTTTLLAEEVGGLPLGG